MCLAQKLKQHNLRLKKHSMYILHRIARGETEIDLQNEQKKTIVWTRRLLLRKRCKISTGSTCK